ncbi:MAG: ATP-binding cassette domain-containing protein [Longimicrobiales bacterium]|nr:ATP-binding cassette domain-containing protein [Longimicrobiales bacterium]
MSFETAPALEGRGLVKKYHAHRALDGVDVRVERGEAVALVGESGSGKTTLLRTFNALVRPDAGEARVEGRPVAGEDPVALRRRTGYVPQEGGLLPHWTVLRNASLVPTLLGMPDAAERGRAALARVGLDPDVFGPRHPLQLSGGQRQRVALARALAADPPVILLDEPFGALDALTRGELVETFREALAAPGTSALLVTHDLRVAFRLAQRVAVLKDGRILRCDTPEALRARPGDAYVAALLARGGVA